MSFVTVCCLLLCMADANDRASHSCNNCKQQQQKDCSKSMVNSETRQAMNISVDTVKTVVEIQAAKLQLLALQMQQKECANQMFLQQMVLGQQQNNQPATSNLQSAQLSIQQNQPVTQNLQSAQLSIQQNQPVMQNLQSAQLSIQQNQPIMQNLQSAQLLNQTTQQQQMQPNLVQQQMLQQQQQQQQLQLQQQTQLQQQQQQLQLQIQQQSQPEVQQPPAPQPIIVGASSSGKLTVVRSNTLFPTYAPNVE